MRLTIADICKIKSGKRLPKGCVFADGITQYPYIRARDIKAGKINGDDLVYLDEEIHKKLSQYIVTTNDVVITIVGASVGDVALVTEQFNGFNLTENAVRLTDFRDDVNPVFIAYVLNSQSYWELMQKIAGGSAQPKLGIYKIEGIPLNLPAYEQQNKIVDILSSYDNLIENNQRQIKLLEEAAQRLYKEWFVDLRFPGHENTPIVDGVPEGWKQCLLGDINCSLESGSRPKGGIDVSLVDGVPSIGAENVIGLGCYNYSSEKLITKDFFSKMKRGKLCDKDILIYKDGAYIGRTSLFQDGFPHLEAAVNEHVFLLHAADEHIQYYLFFTLYQQKYYQKMQKLNKNAAQPGINSKAMMSLPVLLPTEDILDRFDSFTMPLMHKIFNLAKQNRQLELARDRLLPELMSGEIEV